MQTKHAGTREAVTRDAPLLYRITVRGVVPEVWCDRLGGLQITSASRGRSTLEGPLADQAALAGVLDTLCQLGLPIIKLRSFPATRVNERDHRPTNKGGDHHVEQ